MEKNVLFITRHYLDDNNGGANASKGFIYAFEKVFGKIDLIYPEHDGTDCSAYIPASCTLFPCYDKRSKIMKGLDIYRGRLHRFTDFVARHLKEHEYDIVVLDHSLTAASILGYVRNSGAKIITIHHNVEKLYIKDNEPSWLYRIPSDYFAMKAERDALLYSDINLTLTEKDAQIFKSWYPNRELNIHNIGICEYRNLGTPEFLQEDRKEPVFIITGSLCFKQSLRPILSFLKDYYPVMKEVCPSAQLIISGRNPSEELLKACKDLSSVKIVPNPENMNEIVRQSDYYVCPIDAGSGIKLRIMDGLKQGLPVLAHEVSARGYDYIADAGCLFVYQGLDTFRHSLRSLLDCNVSKEKVYASFCHVFSVESKAERLKEILKEHNILLDNR